MINRSEIFGQKVSGNNNYNSIKNLIHNSSPVGIRINLRWYDRIILEFRQQLKLSGGLKLHRPLGVAAQQTINLSRAYKKKPLQIYHHPFHANDITSSCSLDA